MASTAAIFLFRIQTESRESAVLRLTLQRSFLLRGPPGTLSQAFNTENKNKKPRHARVSVPVERLRLAGKEGTEWVRGSGCTATSESGLSNQNQLKCYSFVDRIYIQYRNWFIVQKVMHSELRTTIFTLSSGVLYFRQKIIWFDKRNGSFMQTGESHHSD